MAIEADSPTQWLKLMMIKQDISGEKLADVLSVSPSFVSRILSGKQEIKLTSTQWFDAAHLFNMPLVDFMSNFDEADV